MLLRFDAMLWPNLTWVTKILMRAISNVHAGRRFPTPDPLCLAAIEKITPRIEKAVTLLRFQNELP